MLYLPWQFDMLGGVDVVVDRVASGMDRNLFPCTIWIGEQDWVKSGEYQDRDGRRFLSVNFPSPPASFAIAWLRYVFTLGRRVRRISQLLNEHRIDVVNCHFPTPNVYALALMKRLGLWRGRLVLSFHGSDVLAIVPSNRVWRTIAGVTDAVTAVSDTLAKQVLATGLWPANKIHQIPNGLDCEQFKPDHPSPLGEPDYRYILAVGNFIPLKGQDVLLHAFRRIADRYPGVNLVLAGGAQKGTWLEHLKMLAKDLGIEERTLFLRDVPHSRIPALIRGAEVFAHASRREGLPLVLLEAGAMGRAVVATSVGGIPEIISSPDLGRLVSPDDPAGLAAEISALLDNMELRRTLGDSLQNAVRTRFSIGSMCDAYGRVLFGQLVEPAVQDRSFR